MDDLDMFLKVFPVHGKLMFSDLLNNKRKHGRGSRIACGVVRQSGLECEHTFRSGVP